SINLEQSKGNLELARLKFEQAKADFDETMNMAEQFNLSKAKIKKLTEERIQSLKENIGGIMGVETLVETKSSSSKKRKAGGKKTSPSSTKSANDSETQEKSAEKPKIEEMDTVNEKIILTEEHLESSALN
ncbi:MAG: hypothetical protein KDD35_12265, partial [Bdellovibrionales bacterium]|nr:hypothetical protein [Bdellovibrionales bacterium]